MDRLIVLLSLSICPSFIAGCTTGPGSMEYTSQNNALPTMERVASNAHKCWFKSNDKAFTKYQFAPELNSYSQRPRILVVPTHNPGERPVLVIEAQGNPAKVSVYGNMMDQTEGKRIAKDVERWVKGDNKC